MDSRRSDDLHRKYIKTDIEDLEKFVKRNLRKRQVVGEILDDLTYRRTQRAKQLRKEVKGILQGDVKLPPPPRPGNVGNQIEMLDD